MVSGGISIAQQKHENGSVDWGRVGVEAAIGAIPIPGGGGAAAGREAAATAGREALETTGREAAEQAARSTGERQLSTIGTDAAENLGDDTARVAHDACNGAACFTGDTPVLMADGSSKPIQDVQPGDQVTAWDPDTDTTQPRTVTRTWTHENTETLVVGLEDGGQVETTTGHPFLTRDRGWTPAGHLKPGDQLHTPDNTWVTVQSIEATGHARTVHNLEIEDLHTYHVHTGTTWTTVHNSCNVSGSEEITSRAARRQAMREQGIPTSQQPVRQMKTDAGYSYEYEVPKSGGGSQLKVVSDETTDRVAGHGPHWEAGTAKNGAPKDPLGRTRVYNDKSKVNYGS